MFDDWNSREDRSEYCVRDLVVGSFGWQVDHVAVFTDRGKPGDGVFRRYSLIEASLATVFSAAIMRRQDRIEDGVMW